ncbi:DNA polymerase/3'-5' exonuclease PolX [Cytophagaceae bacterium YF14B1]|uniref:DNA polymerase/3'-5' exonuclease PolX n=1 Tax=Xanthocytophaga flava TaxID=3048013 RepID=A0AAE3UAL0_9BACT|nr:DNA polymerase/3'-5' exonuclease PolX [Xanthocytophaga flavus]MDJ1485656.1 DNA polymerase/3'-5' exonuclease PolX [Xanthocytophaga flavus]
MENNEIIRLFELTTKLFELYDENPFKIRSYTNAILALEKVSQLLDTLSVEQLTHIEGIGKSIADKIFLLNTEGTFPELQNLLAQTPEGIIDILNIKGLGPKKVKILWKDLGIETTDALLQACEENKVATLKGFGEKTQENIRQALLFQQANTGKMHYADAETSAAFLLKAFSDWNITAQLTGQMARKSDVVEKIQLVVATDSPASVEQKLDQLPELEKSRDSGPFAWRGRLAASGLPVEILSVKPTAFVSITFVYSATPEHSAHITELGKTLFQVAVGNSYTDEKQIYEKAGLPYIIPEMREGLDEFTWMKTHAAEEIVELKNLKGTLHNHSTYSDGKHTLEEMATYCQSMGYEYLGISDHSKSAFYANGLQEDRVARQQTEIDVLNEKLAPFRIFKGIESDILNDGSLDYDQSVLKTFDFIVASIHSNLRMDEDKATQRLIKAIENPYTTILGHPTGRLLLRREGYPIDHKKVIDACAANGVIIEINANPWRLDIDWHWVPYCMEKGVMISINPDAHETAGLHDMAYGVHSARKGGLLTSMTFNALSLTDVEAYFQKRRSR